MRLRWIVAALVVVLAAAVGPASAKEGTPVLSAHGIGAVRFGTEKAVAVGTLTRLLGQSSRRFVSDGCGPSYYTEVEWGHLYVEFRRGRLSGFRYMRGAWTKRGVGYGADRRELRPRLAAANGITLGSTLQQLRHAEGRLRLVGTDRWQSRQGLVFYASFSTPQPPPPTSRITEIKVGTCGDF